MNKRPFPDQSSDSDLLITPEIEEALRRKVDENGHVILDYCFLDESLDDDPVAGPKIRRLLDEIFYPSQKKALRGRINGKKMNRERFKRQAALRSSIATSRAKYEEVVKHEDDTDFSNPNFRTRNDISSHVDRFGKI